MSDRFATLIWAALLAFCLVLPGAAHAGGRVAEVENRGEALSFHPVIEAESYTLTVDGPCEYHYQTTSRDGELRFKLDDETFDGVYRFTLVATPAIDPELRKKLLEARESGATAELRRLCRDGRLPSSDDLTQSGSFVVVKSKIVYDPLPEAERKSDRDAAE